MLTEFVWGLDLHAGGCRGAGSGGECKGRWGIWEYRLN